MRKPPLKENHSFSFYIDTHVHKHTHTYMDGKPEHEREIFLPPNSIVIF